MPSEFTIRVRASAHWLKQSAPWDVFFHGTFTSFVSPLQANGVVRTTFRDLAAKVVHGHVEVAWCLERHKSGQPHVHGLVRVLDGAGDLKPNILVGFWRSSGKLAGVAKARRYRPGGADERYVVKHGGDLERQVACPRALACTRRGCRVSPVSWD